MYGCPDTCAIVSKLAQIPQPLCVEKRLFYESINRKTLEYERKIEVGLKYPLLDKKSLDVRCYADASFVSFSDGLSQLGFCVSLMEEHDRFALLKCRSAKFRQVCDNAMAAEARAFAYRFDAALCSQTRP